MSSSSWGDGGCRDITVVLRKLESEIKGESRELEGRLGVIRRKDGTCELCIGHVGLTAEGQECWHQKGYDYSGRHLW